MPPVRLSLAHTLSQEAPDSDASELELVARARAGEDEAFAALYRRYRGVIFGACLKRIGDRQLAEDIVQDTFLRAYTNLQRFQTSRPLLPWLKSIAMNRCVDVARRAAKTTVGTEVEDESVRCTDEDPTLDAVVMSEDRRGLEQALRRLPPRQRRALLLQVVEGWSHADVARAEGTSIASAKALLFHARENLRRACRRELLAGLLMPVQALRLRLRNRFIRARLQMRLTAETWLTASGASIGQTVAAIALAVAAIAPGVSPSIAGGAAAAIAPSNPTRSSTGTPSRVNGYAVRRAPTTLRNLLHPTRGATPEDTQFTSVTPSPNYQQDHTLFATGRVPCTQTFCTAMFVSTDGGTNWKQRRSLHLTGTSLLLPPTYPMDQRIFAMGPSGLQVSNDDAQSFVLAAPIQGDAAISPLFGHGDSRILIGTSVLTEYWADKRVVKPAAVAGPVGTWTSIAFSPSYAKDGTVFVGGVSPDASGVLRPTINRCTSVCNTVTLGLDADTPWIRPSPTFAIDHTVYAFTTHAFYRSVDAGQTFTARTPSFGGGSFVRDVFVSPSGALYAAVQSTSKTARSMWRSSDAGRTWQPIRVSLKSFVHGAVAVLELRDGRLLAIAADTGLACSRNAGRSWSSRC